MVVRGLCPSPILGAKGNREFFLYLAKSSARPGGIGDVERLIEEMVGSASGEVLEQKAR